MTEPTRTPERLDFTIIHEHATAMLAEYRAFEQARPKYKAKIKTVAAAANADPGALHKLVSTSANGTIAAYRAKLDRASLIFHNIGAIAPE